jgi:hypothetical protein
VLAERAGRYPLPLAMVPAGPAVVSSLDEINLGLAGFRGAGDARSAPRFADGVARTGGAVGPGWWLAAIDPPTARGVSLEVGLAATPTSCGRPGVVVEFGAARVAARLAPAGLEVDTPGAAPVVVKLTRPPTTLRVEVDRTSSKVSVDGVVVASGAGVGEASAAGTAMFGDQAGCGAAPQTATRWRAVRLEP